MKIITSVFFLLIGLSGFSQTNLEKINEYVNNNRTKLNLSNHDIADLVITNDFTTADDDVFIYHVKQRINGIEVYNSDSNFLIKNGRVINEAGENFISNLQSKINTNSSNISVSNGVTLVTNLLQEPAISNVQVLESNKTKFKLSNGTLEEYPINAELVYYLTNLNTLKLAWNYEFYSQDSNHLWNVMLDAVNGEILYKKDMVISCNFGDRNHLDTHHNNDTSDRFAQNFLKDHSKSTVFTPGTTNYRVIKWNFESPNHATRTLETNPEYTTNASPNGWHNASTTVGGSTATLQYNITRGNNVFAYSDYTNLNPATPTTFTTASSGTYPNLTFDFPYGGNSVVASTYINAATTNLFYQNNIMHDLWYQYGFTEANKNFQAANYARGGAGNDAVNAESQDASQSATPSLNNANFSTPSDGSKPRMQMYLWNFKKQSDLLINNGTLTGTNYKVNDNVFTAGHVDLPVAPSLFTNSLVLYDDGTPDVGQTDNADACAAAVNAAALNGKIAVIRRSTSVANGGSPCNFVIKVKNAQLAGAVAAILVNNVAGGISMSGSDGTITIPAVSMSQADGDALIAAIKASATPINVSLSTPEVYLNADGDFDNGIIAHEYGHGISTRLSGNCLGGSEQMGEGWSDWFWLMMQIKPGDTRNDARGIGTYAQNQATNGLGIREFRYSTDMAVNPHTYADTNNQWFTDVDGNDVINRHGVGSIWAVTLWDLAWNYINKYGYDPNIYAGTGGNNKVMKLVLDAIKINGCNPTMISGRNALIQADQNTTGGQNFCMIWETFARRGMGFSASAGNNSGTAADIQDQTASFDVPAPGPNCTLGLNYYENEDLISVYPNPSTGLINIKINEFVGKVNLQVIDLHGRVVYSLKNSDFTIEKTINVSHLNKGMYLLKIEGEKLNFTKKVILN